MKSILFSALLCLFFLHASAQKEIKFKDIYEKLQVQEKDPVYGMVEEFLKQDTLTPNANFQIGALAADIAKRLDPLTQTKEVFYFIEQAKKYLSIANTKIDEKEARKNRKYYANLVKKENDEKLQLVDIQKEIASRIAKNDEFNENLKVISKHFQAMQEKYIRCLVRFHSISTKYNSINDLYLSSDEQLFKEIKQLTDDFKSCLFHFKEYRNGIKSYPIKSYNQYWTLKPIQNYKLDGLTNSDFLVQDVPLWDFETWATMFTLKMEKEIKPLYQSLYQTDKLFNDALANPQSGTIFQEGIKTILHDLTEKLSPYDQQLLVLRLFEYKYAKYELLSLAKNNPFDSTRNVSLEEKSNYCGKVVLKKLKADSLIVALQEHITNTSLQPYQELITKNYYGEKGLRTYLNKELENNNLVVQNAFDLLKQSSLKKLYNYPCLRKLAYKNDSLALFPQIPNFSTIEPNRYYTAAIDKDNNGNTYLTGYYKAKNSIISFLSKVDKNNVIAWVKVFSIKAHIQQNFNDCGILLKVSNKHCFVVINSSSANGDMFNTLVEVDDLGKDVASQKLTANTIPRTMFIDEVAGTKLIAFKGKTFLSQNTDNEKFTVISMKETLQWTSEIELTGNLTCIVPIEQNYMVFGNFRKVINFFGETVTSAAGSESDKTNVFSTLIDKNGNVIKTSTYLLDKPFFVVDVAKIGSEDFYGVLLLGGIGTSKEIYSPELQKSSALYFSLIEKFGTVYYSNLKK